MSILWNLLSPFRQLFMAIDGVAFSLLDNAYQLVISLSTAEVFQRGTVKSLMHDLYILFGVVAFFKLAMVLVNSIIDPEKLTEKGKGLSGAFFRVIGMIILLAITPFLFDKAYELQGKIVGGDPSKNVIFKTILGENANISGENAGQALQNIALSSLITVNENYIESFNNLECVSNGDGTCTNQGGYTYDPSTCSWDNCKKAVATYNDMYVNENMSPTKLAKYAGVSSKIDGEDVFVYDYMFIITTVVGVFMTYVILSFAIDIAVRMFELVVLEVLSPLFIATFVDPKSTQSGPFKNWITAVGKSYATLFIKLAILAFMILLLSLINRANFSEVGSANGWVKIFVVIGLLIFAKKAPKWIMDIIGIKSDDGLGGLSIGKKLGNAALVGGLVTKAGHSLAGAASSAASLIHRNNQNRRAQKKEAREQLGYDRGLSKASREKRKKARQKASDAGKTLSQMKRDKYKEAGVGMKDSFKQGASALAKGAITGAKVGFKSGDLKSAFKDGRSEAGAVADHLGLTKKTTKVGDWVRSIPDNLEGAWGDPNELDERRKTLEDAKNAKFHSGGKYQAGLGKGKIVESNGDAVRLIEKYGATTEGEALLAQYCETTGKGEEYFNSVKEKLKETKDGFEIDGENVNLNSELYVNGTGGAEEFLKKFNTYKTNSLNSYINAQEQYTQQASAYQGFANTQQAISQNAQAIFQNAQAIASALKQSLPEDLKGISIDVSSMSGIENAIKDFKDKMVLDPKLDELESKLKELKSLENEYKTAEESKDRFKITMGNLKKAMDNLNPIVNNIKGATDAERQQTLAIELAKLDKKLEGIKKPSDTSGNN